MWCKEPIQPAPKKGIIGRFILAIYVQTLSKTSFSHPPPPSSLGLPYSYDLGLKIETRGEEGIERSLKHDRGASYCRVLLYVVSLFAYRSQISDVSQHPLEIWILLNPPPCVCVCYSDLQIS